MGAVDIDPPAIILVAWSPSRLALDEPAVVRAVQSHLQGLENNLGLAGMNVGVWTPDAHALARLEYQLRFDPRAVSAAAILADIADSAGDLMLQNPAPPAPPPATYLEAEEQLRQVLLRHCHKQCGPEEVRRAQEQYDDRLDREVIRQLLQPTGSASKRNSQLALMQFSRLLHRLGLAMDVSLTQRIVATLGGGEEPIPRGQLQQLTTLARTVIALTKGLRC
jgi:hypothetical protein